MALKKFEGENMWGCQGTKLELITLGSYNNKYDCK